jgi:hypothetical protein
MLRDLSALVSGRGIRGSPAVEACRGVSGHTVNVSCGMHLSQTDASEFISCCTGAGAAEPRGTVSRTTVGWDVPFRSVPIWRGTHPMVQITRLTDNKAILGTSHGAAGTSLPVHFGLAGRLITVP